MSISQIKIFLDFIPAQHHEGKRWYVDYYIKNPATGELVRRQIKFNRIRSVTERRKQIKKLVLQINKKLEAGWNPFLEKEAPKGFYKLSEAFEIFIRTKKRELRPDTLRSYQSYIDILNQYLIDTGRNNLYVIDFSRSMAREFLNDRYINKGINERTYNNYLINYKLIWRWLMTYEYSNNNPFEGISKKIEGHKLRIQYLTKEERSIIKNYLEVNDFDFMIICLFAYHALVRTREMTFLKVKHIDILHQQVHLYGSFTKSKKDRHPTIPNSMIEYLKRWNIKNYPGEYYLCSVGMRPGPIHIDGRNIAKKWARMRKVLKFDNKYQFYSLRDSGIIQKIKDGIPPDEVMYQADHHSLEVTNEYVKIANPQIFTGVRDMASKF